MFRWMFAHTQEYCDIPPIQGRSKHKSRGCSFWCRNCRYTILRDTCQLRLVRPIPGVYSSMRWCEQDTLAYGTLSHFVCLHFVFLPHKHSCTGTSNTKSNHSTRQEHEPTAATHVVINYSARLSAIYCAFMLRWRKFPTSHTLKGRSSQEFRFACDFIYFVSEAINMTGTTQKYGMYLNEKVGHIGSIMLLLQNWFMQYSEPRCLSERKVLGKSMQIERRW